MAKAEIFFRHLNNVTGVVLANAKLYTFVYTNSYFSVVNEPSYSVYKGCS